MVLSPVRGFPEDLAAQALTEIFLLVVFTMFRILTSSTQVDFQSDEWQ